MTHTNLIGTKAVARIYGYNRSYKVRGIVEAPRDEKYEYSIVAKDGSWYSVNAKELMAV
jgi:hypothetical protein